MLSFNDKIIVRLLKSKLNGHHDLCLKIIEIKNKDLFNIILNYYIEKDFYNWLSYDIVIRNKLGKLKKIYFNLLENEKEEFIRNQIDFTIYSDFTLDFHFEYYDYYTKNEQNPLGLDKTLIRKRSLTECFNSKWWMTTEKNNIHWQEIHDYITFPLKVKVFNKTFIDFELINNEIIYNNAFLKNNFRNGTIKETNIVLNKFLRLYNNHHITPLIEFGFEQNFNSGYIYVSKDLIIL